MSLGEDVTDTARFAIARIEMLAPVNELVQLCFEKYKLLLAAVHICKLRGEKVGDVLARHVASFSDNDDAANFGQGQTSRLGRPNEPQARKGRVVVPAVTVPLAFGGI